ncbi:hypothetical protein [Lysinibacillus sp. FSL M8-0134]|uniref:hypothetical protein n=1 Tax=Lysinibacillus sp. FSL M8-0134 TaxID=2921717 RepID=UPI00311968CD
MKKGNIFRNMAAALMIAGTVASSIPAASAAPTSAPELPETITVDGKVYTMDVSAGGGYGTATADNMEGRATTLASYQVLGSDVRLYVSPNNHGGDHVAAGWVEATAPRFTARAEIWSNGRLDTTGSNMLNKGSIANATPHPAVGIVSNATPRIFYAW